MNFGIMLGALAAASLANRFSPSFRIPARSLLAAVLGGLLLGYGARIAYGCNIGAYFGGISSTSLHGWLWFAAAFAGSSLGTRLRPWFGLAEREATINDTMKSVPPKRSGLKGDLFLQQGEQQSFSQNQIALLGAIVSAGSISGAARLIGISYKTAWDRIDAMNNLSTKPLVIRSAGGAKGGGTELTEFGRQVLSGFNALQEEHAEFVERLSEKVQHVEDVAQFLHSGQLKSSARNQYRGRVTRISRGL